MHELSLSQGIIDIVCQQAGANNAQRVLAVRVAIGALSHVDAGAIAFCFDAVARGTLAEGAVLAIEQPPGRAHCMTCDTEVAVGGRDQPCPLCNGYRWVLVGGDDLRVIDLEIA